MIEVKFSPLFANCRTITVRETAHHRTGTEIPCNLFQVFNEKLKCYQIIHPEVFIEPGHGKWIKECNLPRHYPNSEVIIIRQKDI